MKDICKQNYQTTKHQNSNTELLTIKNRISSSLIDFKILTIRFKCLNFFNHTSVPQSAYENTQFNP